MNIRKLTPADAPSFYSLRLHGLEEMPYAFGESAAEFARQTAETVAERMRESEKRGDFILGAFDSEDRLLGVVGVRHNDGEKIRHKGIIWGMYVSPEARRRGIGRALIDEVIAITRTMPGLKYLKLCVLVKNREALDLYRAVGFRSFGIEPMGVKVGEEYCDEHHMVLTF